MAPLTATEGAQLLTTAGFSWDSDVERWRFSFGGGYVLALELRDAERGSFALVLENGSRDVLRTDIPIVLDVSHDPAG